jgi:CTP-dependent riboflavin kinase
MIQRMDLLDECLESIQRALHLCELGIVNSGINHGGFYIFMTQ